MHAANEREAVAAMERARFDLVFMDIQMPEMDGFEATSRIRELEKAGARKTPIVAMTAHAMAGDRERCLAAGMDDYLAKPLKKNELLGMLARFQKASAASPTWEGPERPDSSAEDRVPTFPHDRSAPNIAKDRGAKAAPTLRIFTREQFLNQLDGDEELMQTLIALFHENTPRTIANIATAIETRNGKALAAASHALLSSLGAFGAVEAGAITRNLEQLGERNDFTNATGVLAELRRAIEAMNIVMTSYEAAVV